MSISERIELFFEIAALGDMENDRLFPQADDLGFSSFQDWQEKVSKELEWIRENANMVRLNLAPLRKKWPTCCSVLEDVLEKLE